MTIRIAAALAATALLAAPVLTLAGTELAAETPESAAPLAMVDSNGAEPSATGHTWGKGLWQDTGGNQLCAQSNGTWSSTSNGQITGAGGIFSPMTGFWSPGRQKGEYILQGLGQNTENGLYIYRYDAVILRLNPTTYIDELFASIGNSVNYVPYTLTFVSRSSSCT